MRSVSKMFVVVTLTAILGVGFVASAAGAYSGNSVEEFCGKAVQLQTLMDVTNVDPVKPDTIKAYARKVAKGLKKLAKSAPTAELRKDMKTVAKDYAKIAKSGDLSANVGVEPQLRIQDYIRANCTVPTS